MPTTPSYSSNFLSGVLSESLTGEATPVGARFFEPLRAVINRLTKIRQCHDLSDADWLTLGVLRVLHEVKSGRGFLQEIAAQLPNAPDVNQFFATLRSKRRLEVCQEAAEVLCNDLKKTLPDAFAEVPELEKFDLYAGDGHWHSAAAHDTPAFDGGRKSSCGHFFALDLRRELLYHIATADQIERQHEHDMRALKRQSTKALRQGAPKGRKVLYVWDRAGIDFKAWANWKQSGIYFLSQEKENIALESLGPCPQWNAADPRNAGVQSDEHSQSSSGVLLRRICFLDPIELKLYVFLTNEMTLPAGILVELARRRWNIEKTFDQLKNKFGETQAWASTSTAKTMQALFCCMTHALLLAFQYLLDCQHNIRPEHELNRRKKRLNQQAQAAAENYLSFPSLRAKALETHAVHC